jgi:CheY-like chemotaxis protein
VGSTFVIELPISPVEFTTTWVSPPRDSEREAPPWEGRPNVALVIDDDADVADLLKGFLKERGFAVAVAYEGVQGLEEARRLRPCLITLDVQMPGLDGWQVLRLLKSDAATADIPVVLVTIADNKQRGFALGANDYLMKPIDWGRLGGLVDRYRNNGYSGRVLVVEDEPDQRELLASRLRSSGCEVVEAANGRLALTALEDFVPDLILLDLVMPEMDGFEFLSSLRDHNELRDATVVVISGKELDEADYQRLRGQVAEVIAKSEATWDEIQRELERLLKIHVGHALPEEVPQ